MLLDYYRRAEDPFGVTPDPRFLYLGEQLAGPLPAETGNR
jgi:hypothetical protein